MFTLWALRADLTSANLIGANLNGPDLSKSVPTSEGRTLRSADHAASGLSANSHKRYHGGQLLVDAGVLLQKHTVAETHCCRNTTRGNCVPRDAETDYKQGSQVTAP